MIELLQPLAGMGVNAVGVIVLMTFLVAAAWRDVRSNRIPNALVVTGAVVGVAFSLVPGGIGMREMAEGFAIGFVLLLPFYALGVMGAGDVKLMAMTGIFLGVKATLLAGVTTLAAGGIFAIGYALKSGVMLAALRNIRTFLLNASMHLASGSTPRVADMPVTRVRLPYAAAVTIGVLISIVAMDRY
jgi:prepilin peptidase CpaA